ncbi:MAG: hypothetical protein AAF717_16670 [Bacteroidota bacterium]
MENTKRNIHRIDKLIDAAGDIASVNTPPFFKDKVLVRLGQIQEGIQPAQPVLHWFSPKFQAIALLVFVMLNIGALLYYKKDLKAQEVQTFAEIYGFSASEETSILN